MVVQECDLFLGRINTKLGSNDLAWFFIFSERLLLCQWQAIWPCSEGVLAAPGWRAGLAVGYNWRKGGCYWEKRLIVIRLLFSTNS
jgi:hypothetical protein